MIPIALESWQRDGQYFAYRGHRIFWRDGGSASSAPPLLLIHGFPTASWDWARLWPELALRHRVIAPDLIGFGFSDKPAAYDYSILDQATLVEALLGQLGVADYHVLAHDYGDSVAQELLARQGEAGTRPMLRSVCFLNGGLFPETHRPLLAQRLLASPFGRWVSRLMTRERFGKNFSRIFGPHTQPDAAELDGFWALICRNDGLAAAPRLIRYMDERRRHRSRWVEALQRTAIPLRLIDGAADPISGRHMLERYRELVPNADVCVLDEIGHYPQVEAAPRVLAAYREFRAAIDLRPAEDRTPC